MTMKMMRMNSRYLKLLSEAEAAAPLLLLLLLLLVVVVVVVAAAVVVVVVVAVVGVAAVLLKRPNLRLYRPGQVIRAPGGPASHNFYTVGTRRWQFCQPYAPATFIPQKTLLVLISVRG